VPRQALRLEWLTIAWNAGEVGITVGLGLLAGSLALVAFGLDSMVEIFASLVVVWHLRGDRASRSRMVLGLRLVAGAFLALAVVLAAGGTVRLAGGAVPDESPVGVAYLALTVVVMMWLARAKAGAGQVLGAGPLASESRMTYLDSLLAAAILAALIVNAALGWWWADSLAVLAVAVIAVVEGRQNLERARKLEALAARPATPS